MKFPGVRLILIALVMLATAGGSAFAHGSRGGHGGKSAHGGKSGHPGRGHHHARIRVVVAPPVWGPWYSPPWGYAFVPEWSEPVVYIEKDSGAAAPARPPAYWYYCPETQGFYPGIENCPGGWQELLSE